MQCTAIELHRTRRSSFRMDSQVKPLRALKRVEKTQLRSTIGRFRIGPCPTHRCRLVPLKANRVQWWVG